MERKGNEATIATEDTGKQCRRNVSHLRKWPEDDDQLPPAKRTRSTSKKLRN